MRPNDSKRTIPVPVHIDLGDTVFSPKAHGKDILRNTANKVSSGGSDNCSVHISPTKVVVTQLIRETKLNNCTTALHTFTLPLIGSKDGT